MRIKISKPTRFIDEITERKRISLNKLSESLGIKYSSLKKYRRGDLTTPKETFDKLIHLSPNKKYWNSNIEILNSTWGCSKAGRISAEKSDVNKRMKHARRFRKIPSVEIKLNKFFCEFYGALLGDGCISRFKSKDKEKYVIYFSGNKNLDSNYFQWLKEKISREYGIYVYYYEYDKRNVCVLSIRNKSMCINLNSNFNVPIGVKYGKLKISEKIKRLNWDKKKFVLRGLFDTDGSIYARKGEGYRYPIISISSKNEKFIKELCLMLRQEGYPAYISGGNVAIRGIKAIKKWFSDIGSSNPRNMFKYQYFLKNKKLPPKIIEGLLSNGKIHPWLG